MDLLITLVIILLASYLFTLLAKKVKMPSIVALILIGVILGSPVIKRAVIDPNTKFIFVLGDISLLFLMFLCGLESSWNILFKEKRNAALIILCSALFSFILGFLIFLAVGFSLKVAIIVGICMSITAEASIVAVILELKKIKTKVGATIIGAGIIDDIIGFSLFIVVSYFLKKVYVKEDILLTSAILAFFVGIVIRKKLLTEHKNIVKFERILLIFVIPFFFVAMGINFNLNSVLLNPFLLLLTISIAIIGKLVGTFIAKPFTAFGWKQLYLIGWAMNSRGGVGLALAVIAFRSGLLSVDIYSSLVFMALVTTLMFPVILVWMLKKEPNLIR